MQPRAVIFGQVAVAHRLDVLSQAVVPWADLAVLGVGHDGQAALGGDRKGAGHDGIVHDAVAVLGDEFDILGQGQQMIQRFAVKIFRDGDGLVCVAQPHAGGLSLDGMGNFGGRADRLGVGHQVHEGIPARCCCGRAGGDILFILKAGGAPVAVGVDEGRQHGTALGVEHRLPFRDKQPQADIGDLAVAQPDLNRFAGAVLCVADQHGGNLLTISFGPKAPRVFGQKKTFPKREKSKSHTQINSGKKHCTVNFEARNKLHHHSGKLLPVIFT